MRSIYGKGSVVIATVLVLCAVASASASAAQWYVGGKALTGSAKLAATAKVEEPITFSIPGLGMTITCSSLSMESPEILAAGTLKAKEESHLGGCKATVGAKACFVENEWGELFGGIEGLPSLGTSPEDKLELKSPKAYAFVVFELGSNCGAFGGQFALTGKIPFSMSAGQTESVEQTFVGEGTKAKGVNSLNFEGNPVYVTGKFKLKLASGSKWSYHA